MQVLDILNLMGTLSLGNDNIKAQERAIFLQYLNLAHFELYQETANFNQDLLVSETLANVQNSNQVTLTQSPYLVNTVCDVTHKQKLRRVSLTDILEEDPSFTETGQPTHYFMKKNILSFVPVQTAVTSVTIWYIPQPSLFLETTPELDIPYPIVYHPVLADGALYYLFQEEGGFKNAQKANAAQDRWEAGKTKLLSYLYNSSGQRLSTFSNV